MKVGETSENGMLRVHRFAGSVRVTDLTNAGKRGKKVATFAVLPLYARNTTDEGVKKRLGRVSSTLAELTNYGTALQIVKDYIARFPNELELVEGEERGIDVRPGGAEVVVAFNSLGIDLEAEPNNFRLLHRTAYGRSNVAANEQGDAFYQDTRYWPVNKIGARKFYEWLLANRSRIDTMTIRDFTMLWNRLGIAYDYH